MIAVLTQVTSMNSPHMRRFQTGLNPDLCLDVYMFFYRIIPPLFFENDPPFHTHLPINTHAHIHARTALP